MFICACVQASLQVSLQNTHGKQQNVGTSHVDADAQILIQNLRTEVKSCKDRLARLRKSKESLQAEYEDEIEQLQQALELAQSATQWKSDMKMAIMQFEDAPDVETSQRPPAKTGQLSQSLAQKLTTTSDTRESKSSHNKTQRAAAKSIESVEQYILKVFYLNKYALLVR